MKRIKPITKVQLREVPEKACLYDLCVVVLSMFGKCYKCEWGS